MSDGAGTRLALTLGMNKRPKQQAKPPTQAAHPEAQHPRAKTGTPGSESSKAQGPAEGRPQRSRQGR